MRKLMILGLLLLAATAGATPTQVNGQVVVTESFQGNEVSFIAGEILVMLDSGYTQAQFEAQIASLPLLVVTPLGPQGLLKVADTGSLSVAELCDSLQLRSSVDVAEPNAVGEVSTMPNDPALMYQWPIDNEGNIAGSLKPDADVDAPAAWSKTTGSAHVKIGVLDSGIPIDSAGHLCHPDLRDTARIRLDTNYFACDTCPLLQQQVNVIPRDQLGHGTHVAGIIGATSNNGVGIVGMDWHCQMNIAKVADSLGSGTLEAVMRGIYSCVNKGCKVINLSVGFYPYYDVFNLLERAVQYAADHNVLLVCAAGNADGAYTFVESPALFAKQFRNVIAVGASTARDVWAPYSRYTEFGLGNGFVDSAHMITVCAPGGLCNCDTGGIWSTLPNYSVEMSAWAGLNYGYLSGTSMATPQVTGLAALILSLDTSLSADTVRYIIEHSAEDIGDVGFDRRTGWGRINAGRAVWNIGDTIPVIAGGAPAHVASIREAVDMARPHSMVLVGPGTYSETLVRFYGKAITVRADSIRNPNLTTLNGSTIVFEDGETDSTILEGFKILGGGGVVCENSGPTIRRNIFYNQPGGYSFSAAISLWGISALYDGECPATIVNNTIVRSGGNGIFDRSMVLPTIKNNIIDSCGTYGIQYSLVAHPTKEMWQPVLSYNDAYHNSTANYSSSITDVGSGSMSTNPIFAAFFSLDSMSPCKNAGDPDSSYNDPDQTRNDIGAIWDTLTLPFYEDTFDLKVGSRIDGFSLDQNSPNPFNPSTVIIFSIPRSQRVRLEIFDVLGRRVTVLRDEQMDTGEHRVLWHATHCASGVYFYRLSAGPFVETKKMVLLK